MFLDSAYVFDLPMEFKLAIEWHGDRYRLSDFLLDHIEIVEVTDKDTREHVTDRYYVALTECEAWELRDIVDDEGNFACGSPELRNWLYECLDQII